MYVDLGRLAYCVAGGFLGFLLFAVVIRSVDRWRDSRAPEIDAAADDSYWNRREALKFVVRLGTAKSGDEAVAHAKTIAAYLHDETDS